MDFFKMLKFFCYRRIALLFAIIVMAGYIMSFQSDPYQSIYIDPENGIEYKIRTYSFLLYSSLIVYRKEPFLIVFSVWKKYEFFSPNDTFKNHLNTNPYSPIVQKIPSDNDMIRYLILGTECKFPPIKNLEGGKMCFCF